MLQLEDLRLWVFAFDVSINSLILRTGVEARKKVIIFIGI